MSKERFDLESPHFTPAFRRTARLATPHVTILRVGNYRKNVENVVLRVKFIGNSLQEDHQILQPYRRLSMPDVVTLVASGK